MPDGTLMSFTQEQYAEFVKRAREAGYEISAAGR